MSGVALEPSCDTRPRRPLAELGDGLLEHRPHGVGAERDDPRARLELAEEEHLVDELA